MRVLTIATGVPFPPLGGGLSRTFHLLKALAPRHELILAAFTYGNAYDTPSFPVRVVAVPWEWSKSYTAMTSGDLDAAQRAYKHLTYESEQPWFSSALDPGPMEKALRDISSEDIDAVLIEGTPNATFLSCLPKRAIRILDLFDVHSVMAQRAASVGGHDPAALAHDARRTLKFERAAVADCDVCLAVSERDAASATEVLGARNVHVVPNGVDPAYFTPAGSSPEPAALLFTGTMHYEPNADAACYFVEEVLPLIRRAIPTARLDIVGTNPPERVTRLASPEVSVHGRVPDMRPHYQRADLVVVPVRHGGGTRLKVLEAAASGKAIVSTSLGVEGLPFRDSKELLIADSATDFAAAAIALLQDPARRDGLGAAAREVACRYDWAVIGARFCTLVEQVADSAQRAPAGDTA